MGKRIAIACSLLLALGSVSHAAIISWVDGAAGNWSDPNNWIGGIVPTSLDEVRIENGTVTVDSDAACNRLKVGSATGTNGILVLDDPDVTLTLSYGSEAFLIGNSGQGTFNHSAGTVRMASTGQVRISRQVGSQGIYNMSGTALLDATYLRLNEDVGGFNATGGTLALRTHIRGFDVGGFHQGEALLVPGGLGTVGAFTSGYSSSDKQDYYTNAGILEFDIASDSSYDKITSFGGCDVEGGTLQVNLLDGYMPTHGDTFDIWVLSASIRALHLGTGTFASVTLDFAAAWVDTDADERTDTLRLTYVPEPATLALLVGGFGWLLICRKAAWIAQKA